MRCRDPLLIDGSKHVWRTKGVVSTTFEGSEKDFFCQGRSQVIEFNLVLDLRHKFIQDIEELLTKFVLQIFIVVTPFTNWFVCPLFEPFI